MTISAIGIAMSLVSAAVTLGFAVWIVLRLTAAQRRVQKLAARPAIRALEALPAIGERISLAIDRAAPLRDRFELVNRELLAAAESGARWAAEIALVAGTTEDLLDTLVPSMRGSQA